MKSATKPATDIDSPVAIRIDDAAWRDTVPDLEGCCRRCLDATFEATGSPSAQVSLLFTDDAAMRDLNGTYRGRETATNVLSFPADQASLPPGHPRFLGDIALGLGTVVAEAAAQGKTPPAHTHHLIVHGALHLLGHDHVEDNDARIMEDLERMILETLGYADPYATSADVQ